MATSLEDVILGMLGDCLTDTSVSFSKTDDNKLMLSYTEPGPNTIRFWWTGETFRELLENIERHPEGMDDE